VGFFSYMLLNLLILTQLFLPNVRLRLILEYPTISLSSESPSSTLIHSPSSESKRPLSCTAVHTLIRDTLAWNLRQEDFRYRVTQAANHRFWYHLLRESEGETLGRCLTMRTKSNPYKEMISLSTQNSKTLSLWVFFLYVAQLSHS